MFGFLQCCDADEYAQLGRLCLEAWDSCWTPLRPIGAIILSALLPSPGLAILNHLSLLIFAFVFVNARWGMASCAGKMQDDELRASPWFMKSIGVFLLLELMFLGLASVNLTDITAGVLAALGIIGFVRRHYLLLAVAGSLSVLIRAAYLYPMVVLVGISIVECLYRREKKGYFAILFFIGILPQYLLTFKHTGTFSFLDPTTVEFWRNVHFHNSWAGYDTLVPIAQHAWQSNLSVGVQGIIQNYDVINGIKFAIAKLEFYFSSFVPFSKVYLSSPSERLFSPFVFVCHVLALLATILFLKQKVWRLIIPLGLIIGQNILIIPEQRFIFVVQLFLIAFTYLMFIHTIQNRKAVKSGVFK